MYGSRNTNIIARRTNRGTGCIHGKFFLLLRQKKRKAMTKEKSQTKEKKKEPTKSLKEKRAAKQEKKAAKR